MTLRAGLPILAGMKRAHLLRNLLADSSDPENPSPAELEQLFEEAETIAVVGLSRDPLKTARRVPSYLAAKGYDVVPVNPNARRLLGRPAVESLEELVEPVDVVVVFRPSSEAAGHVRAAAARPERPAIWLQEGILAPAEVEAARQAGLVVVQDLCAYRVHSALTG